MKLNRNSKINSNNLFDKSFLFFLLILMSFFFIKCRFNTKEGKHGTSYSVVDSKMRKVFLTEFLTDSIIHVNDTFNLNIKNGWIEHKWRYEKNPEKSKITRGVQLVLEVKNRELMKSFLDEWSIIFKENISITHGFGKLGDNSMYITEPFKFENLDFYVISGWRNIKDSLDLKRRLIGEFSLPKLDSSTMYR